MSVKKTIKILIIICVASFFSYPAQSQIAGMRKTGMLVRDPLVDVKKTVVFLGRINPDGRPYIYATGVLVNVQNIYHLLTAKHVIMNPITGEMQDENLLVFFNLKGGGVTVRPIADMKKEFDIKWVFHADPNVDIGMIPFLIDTGKDDLRVISDDLFLDPRYLFELYDIFFLSYQPGIEPKGKITPIVRNGIISLLNDDGTFYIDASAFPGNTGSPVFLKPSPIRFSRAGLPDASSGLGGRFIGIIGEYINYKELAVSAQTGRPRIVFEENTGLSRVWSTTFIKEIMESEVFRQQLKNIAGKKQK
jgi:hypothetical protein